MLICRTAKLVTLVVIILVIQVACGINEDALDRIERTGVIRIFNNLAAPPWQFRDVNNQPSGVSIDLNRMIAADLGVDLHLTDVDFSGLLPSLLARKSLSASQSAVSHKPQAAVSREPRLTFDIF